MLGYTITENGETQQSVTNGYDALGRLASVTEDNTQKVVYTYDRGSRLVKTAYANGVTEERTYNEAGAVKTIETKNASGETLSGYSYTYYVDGNEHTKTGLSGTTEYTYDGLNRLKIALLAGGDSPEREIALQSAALIEAALDHSKYDITVIDLHGRDWHHTAPDGRQWQVDKNDFSITVDGVRKAFDYALIIIHGTPGEDGKLQGYLDMMGVPYSSCSMTSSVITFDKITAKRTLAGRVNLAREVFLRRGEAFDPAQIVAELGMPLFVKPNANGSSFGVTKVHAPEELPAAIEAAFAQGDEILIEECITGREMGCGMLVAGGREYVFPITEIVSKKDFFDYEAKYTAGFSDEITPADITPEVKAELNRMTREAYRTCRCSGVVRVDFIVTPAGVPYFIELNSIPGMSRGSIVPKQAREMGMSLGELYDIIIADTCRK